VPYFALARGFLTGKYRIAADAGKSQRGAANVKYLEGKGIKIVEAMDIVAAETGAALASIAIAWLAAQPTITAPIASATKIDQLDELLDAVDLTLSADQLARLDAAGA
jgi:aryl-alcohol dehydrogenase-like predicted oxidoreductase